MTLTAPAADPRLDEPDRTRARLVDWLRSAGRQRQHRGLVVAVSGGIDSAVCLGLAVQAYGADRVVALALPDRHSEPVSVDLARKVAQAFGTSLEVRPIDDALTAFGCYRMQAEAIRSQYAPFDEHCHRFRVVFAEDFASPDALPDFRLHVLDTDGVLLHDASLRPDAYRLVVAATNLKQRCRMIETHLEAERRGWGVVGTSNRQELEQGFVVRYGDATGDLLPLAHLLKTHVYHLAETLAVPTDIVTRTPTTDTYSAPQTQDEFFFGLPMTTNDVLWSAFCDDQDPATVAADTALDTTYVQRVFASYQRRSRQAQKLHSVTINPAL